MKNKYFLVATYFLFIILPGCDTTGTKALSGLGQVNPNATPEEKAVWVASGTAAQQMEHEKEIARQSKDEINVNVYHQTVIPESESNKNSDVTYYPPFACTCRTWVDSNGNGKCDARDFDAIAKWHFVRGEQLTIVTGYGSQFPDILGKKETIEIWHEGYLIRSVTTQISEAFFVSLATVDTAHISPGIYIIRRLLDGKEVIPASKVEIIDGQP